MNYPRFLIVLLAGSLATAFASRSARAEEWKNLFDGKTLDGWVQRGGEAKYAVEDGAIVGTTVPKTPNSFLCTEKDYGDFILELEFKVDPQMNSGIQIRSHEFQEGDPQPIGLGKDIPVGRVHGYQVEIDPSDRAWTTGIYDEGRRGWINDLRGNAAARYAFKQNEWNHVRVQAIGDTIKTWLNGVPAANLVDPMTLSGFIALQVHGIGNREETMQVRWRNIRIQDLGESHWEPLFNGKDLSGWNPNVESSWSVKEGVLVGKSSAEQKHHSLLFSGAEYGDFTAKVVFRALSGNSGFFFRAEKTDDEKGIRGFQAEIDTDGKNVGGLYETQGRQWMAQPDEAVLAKAFQPKEWNELTVSAHGQRIVIHLNGHKTVDLVDTEGASSGLLALQLHGGQDMNVEFKAVERLRTAGERPADEPVTPADAASLPPVVPEGAEVKKLAEGFTFTEGPAEAANGWIYFSDIPNEHINIYKPESGEVERFRENSGRTNGLMWTPAGALIACEGGNRRVTRTFGDEITVLADSFEGKKLNSPNDLVLDDIGGLYFTDPRYGKEDDMELDVMGVYYIDRGGKISRVVDDAVKPNGLILSNDYQTLYLADPGSEKILAYDVKEDGALENRRDFAPVGSDGMTIDERGNVYCTWKGEVWIFSPAGEEIARIACPEAPANCTFGGPEGKTLYLTARKGFYSIGLNVRGGRTRNGG